MSAYRRLTPTQRTKLQKVRTMSTSTYESIERLVELVDCCKCEADPNCVPCRLFGMIAQIERAMARFREELDYHLVTGR